MAHQCRPWRPCRPSLHLSQRRLHAHTPAPCAGLPCVGAVTTGHAQIPTAPLSPKPLHSHTTDGSAQSAHGKQTQHRPKKRTAGSAASPGNTKDVSTAPIPSFPSTPFLPLTPATHTQPHAAVVRCFCPRCDAYPRNDPKGADVFARQRTANPVPVAQRGKACRIGVRLAAAARPKYRILTCCALDALSSCKCPLTPESRQRIAPLVQRSSTTDATQRPLTHSAIPRGREMPPSTAVPRHTHCPRESCAASHRVMHVELVQRRCAALVRMCRCAIGEHAPVSPLSPLSPFGPVGPVAPDRCTNTAVG